MESATYSGSRTTSTNGGYPEDNGDAAAAYTRNISGGASGGGHTTPRGALSPIPIPKHAAEARSAYLGNGTPPPEGSRYAARDEYIEEFGDDVRTPGKNSVVLNISSVSAVSGQHAATLTGRSPSAGLASARSHIGSKPHAATAAANNNAVEGDEDSRHKLVQVIAQRNNAMNRSQQLEAANRALTDKVQSLESEKVSLHTKILQLEQRVDFLSEELAIERDSHSQLAHIKAQQRDNKAPTIRSASPAYAGADPVQANGPDGIPLPNSGDSTPALAESTLLGRSQSQRDQGLSGAQMRERERDAQVRHMLRELKDENRELKARVAELEDQQAMMVPYPAGGSAPTTARQSRPNTPTKGSLAPSRAGSSNALTSSRKAASTSARASVTAVSPIASRRSQGTSTPAAASYVPPQRFIASKSVASMEEEQKRRAPSAGPSVASRNPSTTRKPSPVTRQGSASQPRGASPAVTVARRSSPFDRAAPSKRVAPPPPGRQSPMYSRNASSASRPGASTPTRSASAPKSAPPQASRVSVASAVRGSVKPTSSSAKRPVIAVSKAEKATPVTAKRKAPPSQPSGHPVSANVNLRPSRVSPVRDETVTFSSATYKTQYHPTRMVRHYDWEEPGEKVATSTSVR